jgi:quercetin dioxygenase-like cupin family protein
MKCLNSRLLIATAMLAFVGGAAAQAISVPPSLMVKRTLSLKQDMEIPGCEAVMASVELPPGSAEGSHTHPAEVCVCVQEGVISFEHEGKPTTTLKAGDVFYVTPGKIHQAINNGSVIARLSAVFVAEKGKPLTTPLK